MLIQGLALFGFAFTSELAVFILLAVLLGLGTALVYPTFLATVAENTHPADRAHSLGIFRLWRDLGYAIGALLTGLIADTMGVPASIITVALITMISAAIIYFRMD
jgi:predicted MFS family arabinose efflux permease